MKPRRFLRRGCLLRCIAIAAIGIAAVFPACAQETEDEPRITLEANNRALGEVLDQISRDTGYTFALEESWQDRPVKASLRNVPLHRALKRILSSLNHALIYESDTDIRVAIYGEPGARPSGPVPSDRSPRLPVDEPPQPDSFEDPDASEKEAEPPNPEGNESAAENPEPENPGETVTDGTSRAD